MMCPYCEQGGELGDENELLFEARQTAFGEMKTLYMGAGIWTDDEPRIFVSLCLYGRDIMIARFPISYCPKCGRKLT